MLPVIAIATSCGQRDVGGDPLPGPQPGELAGARAAADQHQVPHPQRARELLTGSTTTRPCRTTTIRTPRRLPSTTRYLRSVPHFSV